MVMTRSEIYLQAAEVIDDNVSSYSCCAITYDELSKHATARANARSLYTSIFFDGSAGFGPLEAIFVINAEPNPRELRVLMLCLAAACWRDFV